MTRPVDIYLIREEPASHGAYDAYTPVTRRRMAEIPGGNVRAAYEALSHGLHPQITFRLALAEDYDNERQLMYNGIRYQITDAVLNNDGIDLICERWTGDV